MKRFLQFSLLIAGVSLMTVTSSCQKDYNATTADDTIKTRNPFLGDFTCIMNGEQFVADFKSFSDVTFEDTRTISIVAEKFSYDRDPEVSQVFTLTITPYEGPKSYPLNGWSVRASYNDRKKDGGTINYNGKVTDESAFIKLNSDGAAYNGNFAFELKPVGATNDSFNIIITNGEFNLPK
jgi:hypothetical protein